MNVDQVAALPFAVLWVGSLGIWAASRVLRPDGRAWSSLAGVLALGAATAMAIPTADAAFGGTVRRDGAVVVASLVVLLSTAGAMLLHVGRVGRGSTRAAEGAALALIAASGALLVAAAGDLLVVFVGVELMAVPLYALAGLVRDADGPHRVALGQLLHGAVATALLGFGIALVHAGTGALGLADLGRTDAPLALAGTALVLTALGHRAMLVPFHPSGAHAIMAAPSHLGAFIAIVPRTALLALLFRIGGSVTDPVAAVDWRASLAIAAAIGIVVADLGALRQTSLRGLVAYAALSQGSYVVIALASGVEATGAAMLLLVVGAAASLGAFGAIARLGADEPNVADLAGLVRRRPVFGATLVVLMLAVAGLPPTGGFVAKLFIFEAAMRAQLAWLVVLAAATSAASAAAYLRVIFACLADGDGAPVHRWSVSAAVVVVMAGVVIALGVMPGLVLEPVRGLRF